MELITEVIEIVLDPLLLDMIEVPVERIFLR